MPTPNIGHLIPGPVQVFVGLGVNKVLQALGIAEDGVRIVKEYEYLPVKSDLGNVPVNYVYHGRFCMASFLLTYIREAVRELLDNPLQSFNDGGEYGIETAGMRGALLLTDPAQRGVGAVDNALRLLLWAPYASRYGGEEFHNFPTCKLNSYNDEWSGSKPSMFPYVIEPVGQANLCSGATVYYNHDDSGFPGNICG